MQVLFKLLPDNAYIELNLWFHKYNQLIMPRVRDDIRVSNWPFIIARYGDADVALWTAKFSQFDPGHNNIELLTDLHAILFLNICKPPLNTFCRISGVQVSLLNYYITYQVCFVPHWDWIKSQGNQTAANTTKIIVFNSLIMFKGRRRRAESEQEPLWHYDLLLIEGDAQSQPL